MMLANICQYLVFSKYCIFIVLCVCARTHAMAQVQHPEDNLH